MLERARLAASPIGLGLAALGRPAYINLGRDDDLGADRSVERMRSRSHGVADAAYDAGVRYFDVARSYGRAEEFLAGWLSERRVAPGEVLIGSKWGYEYTGRWRMDADKHEVKDHSLASFRRQLAHTRELLGEHLCLYQAHSVTPDSPLLDDHETLAALSELRDEGVAVGLTLSGPAQPTVLSRAIDVEVGGERVFSCVQATWNLLEQSSGPALRDAHSAGMAVIVKEALANGRLTDRGARCDPGTNLDLARRIASQRSVPLDRLAIAAAMAQPWADVVLSGASTTEQLRSNLAAASMELRDEELAALQEVAMQPEPYWDARRSLPWS